MQYSNETMRLLYERASCRSFKDEAVPDDVLKEIIEAGCHAATGGNLQPYSIIKITSEDKKDQLVNECGMQNIVKKAPVNLLFCIDWRRTKKWAEANDAPYTALNSYRHFWIAFQDTIIAAQNICTAADALGLGSVYIGTVESCFMELKDLCEIPEGVFPVVLLSLGYPTVYPEPRKKLGYDAIVHDEIYDDPSIDKINTYMNDKYDNKSFPLSEKNLETLYEVSKDVGGETYANKIIDKSKDRGFINMAQRYFALHYSANWACTGNKEFLDALRAYGFTWVDGEDKLMK